MKEFCKVKNLLKTVTFVVLAALVAGMFGVASPSLAQDPTATPKPLGSEEGKLTIWVNAERAPILEAAAKQFTAKYGIEIRITTMGFGDVRSNFELAGPAGEGPDVLLGAHDWIGSFYANGLVASIELSDELKAKFDPVALRAFTYNGELVGLPYQVEAIAMYYNTDLVPTAPEKWDDAIAIAKKLVADGKAERGIAIPPDPYHSFPLLTGFGGGVFGLDDKGSYDPSKVLLDSEGTIAGATELDKLIKEGVFADGVGYDQAKDLFLKGKLGMWITGPWELNNVINSGVKFGVARIPTMKQEAAPFVGVQGFMVNKLSKNVLLAQSFLTEFVATDEVMTALFKAQFGIPAWLPIRPAAFTEAPALEGFAASVAVGQPMPAIPQMAAFWNTAGNALTLIYQQKGDPAAIMKDAAKAAREEIAKK